MLRLLTRKCSLFPWPSQEMRTSLATNEVKRHLVVTPPAIKNSSLHASINQALHINLNQWSSLSLKMNWIICTNTSSTNASQLLSTFIFVPSQAWGHDARMIKE
mmetsp:Transcript_11889/g.24229  ORF Transcript_11889/g.24229 Transcript_11889/m.24229 type:complete len:104 (-) Transcript_11889:206-517(-)